MYNGVLYWHSGPQERIRTFLQQMLPTSADEEVDDVKSLTESYHKYKREYVKHLGFNTNNENLSEYFLTSESLSSNSNFAGA